MEPETENSVLNLLHNIFKEYQRGSDTVEKIDILKCLFEYNIIDHCGYNIFHISEFLNQLNPTNDQMNLKQFLILIFYIYQNQTTGDNTTIVTNISEEKAIQFLEKRECKNEVIISDNIIKKFIDKKKIEPYFPYEYPNFSDDTIRNIVNYENLVIISRYLKSIKNQIYNKYASEIEDREESCINIVGFNNFVFDFPIFANFPSETIANIIRNFINIEVKVEDEQKLLKKLFEKKLKNKEISEILNNFIIPTEDVNYTISTFVIILSYFAVSLKSTENSHFEERIRFFFEEQLELQSEFSKNIIQPEILTEDDKEELDADYLPESLTLNKAKLRQENPNETASFIEDFLSFLDKILPEEDKNILSFSNDIPNHSNTLSSNPLKIIPAKFPVEKLFVEVQEQKERELEKKENAQIMRAAKPKKEKDKNPNPLEFSMEQVPNETYHDLKYLGNPRVETLTHRFLKKTYKEILPNSNVYPSIIKEVLMIPNIIPIRPMELIVESYKDQVSGHLEKAIRRLEKAKENLPATFAKADQVNLFFNLTFGSLYESLDFDIVALKYYYNAKNDTDKLQLVDPDRALVYCFLGELFIKLKEYNWAMRCFLHAKQIREETIGGDTPDTATVYNNLGVVAYYLQSYLPANGYFKLAFQIYKEMLGLTHPRTLMIKSNLTKMNQLSFNKAIEFKTLSKYPLPGQKIEGKRKKK